MSSYQETSSLGQTNLVSRVSMEMTLLSVTETFTMVPASAQTSDLFYSHQLDLIQPTSTSFYPSSLAWPSLQSAFLV